MSHIIGEVYIVEVYDHHAKRDQKRFYYVRAECIGQNDIGDVGYFADMDGNVFHNSYDSPESETFWIDKKEIIPRYPLSHGIWRKVEPPKQLQSNQQG